MKKNEAGVYRKGCERKLLKMNGGVRYVGRLLFDLE